MDKLIYTAMTGAKATMDQQGAVANNLANVSTSGFKSELHRLRAVQVQSQSLPTRAFAVDATVATDYTPGTIMQTGNALDVAVNGKGWIAVTAPDGKEAYTRGGSLTLDQNGILRTQDGLEVVGDGGQISIPPDNTIDIGADGTISTVPLNGARNTATTVGRIKLVNPPEGQLKHGDDGLFRLSSGNPADVDESVRVAGGYLEGSNVNMVEQMVSMISLQRNYELNIRMLTGAQDNDKTATQVIAFSS
jgi:flagellar basal-body rod protein FlgF